MEEQCNHVHTLWGGGGLAKVMMTANDRTKITHHSKTDIKITCLEESRNIFTQANNTPFLVEPLLSELGLIGTQWEQFSQIAMGLYHPPQDAPNNVKWLLPLLERLVEITDHPNKITPEQHKQGWMKAKESTSSSLSGAHFGHYKAGATHAVINKLYTLLADIPLWMGFPIANGRRASMLC